MENDELNLSIDLSNIKNLPYTIFNVIKKYIQHKFLYRYQTKIKIFYHLIQKKTQKKKIKKIKYLLSQKYYIQYHLLVAWPVFY